MVNSLTKVVLPEPLEPKRTYLSDGFIDKKQAFKIGLEPNDLLTLLISIEFFSINCYTF